MTKTNKKINLLLAIIISLLFLSTSFSFAQTTELPESAERSDKLTQSLPDPTSPPLSPCPGPEREPRFVYREKVVHEERQFRAEHTGCGGDILMRNWQVVGLEMGRCPGTSENKDCSDPQWTDDFVYFYDRYTPNQDGEVFDEVGSWQKAWPASARWLTEEELEEEYGEPVPFPTCQTDCLQAPPGVPGEAEEFGQEDPYYFNNPWLPGMAGGEKPQNIEQLRNKNLLGGDNPLKRTPLPVKLFWWNIPGWHEGWIENGEFKECEDDPNNIACVDSYIIKFDNINREDRPAKFHRYEVVNKLREEGYEYNEAQDKFEELEIENRNAYIDYREEHDDARSLDVMRYDRDNIIGCDNCGTEQEIWLDTNTFNPLDFDPKYEYDREKREWMRDYLLEKFEGDNALQEIINNTYNSYGRPAFFRSGTEHTYSLQATCPSHDYLEEEEGTRGPEATFSFETSDAPELISPIDPNWVSPYDSKLYDPNFDASRVQSEEYGYENGYRYPAETSQTIGDDTVASTIDGPRENKGLKSWRDELSDTDSIWSEDSYSLILQNQVSFREELKWAQQWYQPTPDARPEPPRVYLMSFGEGIRVLTETINEYGEPVLEDCHDQLTETVKDNPICNYRRRPVEPDETQHRYPEPNHLDDEMDFFTLPENEEEDVYTWNIASCRERAGTDCTDFSQRWRFQLDNRETRRLFPPKNINPPNMENEGVSEDDATVGFPFRVRWDGRFGARSYVYRIREKGSDSWEDIKIKNSRNIYYSTGRWRKFNNDDFDTEATDWDDWENDDISNNLDSNNNSSNSIDPDSTFNNLYSNSDDNIYWTGDLTPDTTYEWDVKACWDESYYDGDAEKDDDKYVEEIDSWINNNKQCSDWRSKDNRYDDAPFEFKTAGRPPKSTEIISPSFFEKIKHPVKIDWKEIPGAKSYAIILQKCSSSNLDLSSGETESVDCSDQDIVISSADIGALISDSEFTYYDELSLFSTYQYKIYSCINPVEESQTYLKHKDGSFAETFNLPNIINMPDDMLEAGCHLQKSSDKMIFVPTLSPPENLNPGNKEADNPERIPADDSFQTLSWDKISGAEAYRVEINLLEENTEEEAGIKKAYAQEDDSYPKEIIAKETKVRHDFSLPGEYSWTVQSCITDNCESYKTKINEKNTVKSSKSDPSYIQIHTPSFLGFEGVVPCGRNINIFSGENPDLDSRDDCKLSHLFVMIGLIIEEILVKIIIPYSLVLLLLYTGYLYYTGLGDPTTMQKVFKVWEYALKGYLLILLSWAIVGALLTVLGYQFGVWWQITSNL
ncbi:MAG: hypothetical protein ACQEP3_01020 [Patescibacteria group bacterium]